MSGYSVGSVILNSASIYFDFNAPIITNTFTSTFVETLSVDTYNSNSFTIFPNPAKDEVTIQLESANFGNVKINIYDIQGKAILKDINFETNASTIDISNLESGLYFVQLNNGIHKQVKKLVIE